MLLKKTVYLESDALLALRRMAETRGCNRQQIIREALKSYINKAGRRPSKRPNPAQ
jgi:hypothetical protein